MSASQEGAQRLALLHCQVRQPAIRLHRLISPSPFAAQGGYIIFNATMSASLGMTLNATSPNTYNLDLFNAERHTTGGHLYPSTCCSQQKGKHISKFPKETSVPLQTFQKASDLLCCNTK